MGKKEYRTVADVVKIKGDYLKKLCGIKSKEVNQNARIPSIQQKNKKMGKV